MSNVNTKVDAGTPSMSWTLPIGAVIRPSTPLNLEGRFRAVVKVNELTYELPSTHPTERDALTAIEGFLEEHTNWNE